MHSFGLCPLRASMPAQSIPGRSSFMRSWWLACFCSGSVCRRVKMSMNGMNSCIPGFRRWFLHSVGGRCRKAVAESALSGRFYVLVLEATAYGTSNPLPNSPERGATRLIPQFDRLLPSFALIGLLKTEGCEAVCLLHTLGAVTEERKASPDSGSAASRTRTGRRSSF